jgi:beta-glucosidase
MDRRDWLIKTGMAGTGLMLSRYLKASDLFRYMPVISQERFRSDFKWGCSCAQTEGAWNIDGKSESNWDYFSRIPGKIANGENADVAADFYHRFSEDIDLIKAMNFDIFRFSFSWPRIIPAGTGAVNPKGNFYHRYRQMPVCQREPGLIYHWDMPGAGSRGGWTNRKMIDWFSEYVVFYQRNTAVR